MHSTTSLKQTFPLAFYLKISACLCYAIIHILSKKLSVLGLTIIEITFLQYFIASILIIPYFIKKKHSFKYKFPFMLFCRSLIAWIGILLMYYSFTILKISDALIPILAGPIFTLIGAYYLLQEKLSKLRIFSITLGISGLLINSCFWLSYKTPNLNYYEYFFPLCVSLLFSGVAIMSKLLIIKGEKPEHLASSSLIIVSTLSIVSYCFSSHSSINSNTVWIASIMAILTVASQFLHNLAFKYAEVSKLLPIGPSKFIFSTLLAFLFFYEIPSQFTLIGAILIIISLFTLTKEK